MKKKALKIVSAGLLIVPLLLSGCIYVGPGGGTTTPGNTITRKFDITNFDSIDASGAFEVVITRAGSFSIRVTTGENLFNNNNIIVEKQGSNLNLSVRNINFFSRPSYRADISLPDLKRLSLSGASHGSATGVSSTGDMAINLSGASNANIDATAAANMRLDITGASKITGKLKAGGKTNIGASGAGNVTITGTSGGDGAIEGSGASTIDLRDYSMPNAGVKLSGGSRATVSTSGRLDVDISGGSHLTHLGNPTINTIDVSGGSSIDKG